MWQSLPFVILSETKDLWIGNQWDLSLSLKMTREGHPERSERSHVGIGSFVGTQDDTPVRHPERSEGSCVRSR